MLFESALLESAGRLHTQQRWTALASMAAQAAAVAGMVMASIIFTDTLPGRMAGIIVLPTPPLSRAESQEPARQPRESAVTTTATGAIQQPERIPIRVLQVVDPPPAPYLGSDENGVVGGPGPGGTGNAIANEVARRAAPVMPKPLATRVVRLSRPEPGALLYRVEPRYPHLAVVTRTSGTVVLHATISPEGRIVNLEAVSGPALLVGAAVEAVRQWRYRPYVLNGQPLAVETQITVNFVLHP